MNVLLGFVNATSGDASLFGTSVREPISRQRIGYLPELTYYYKPNPCSRNWIFMRIGW